MLLLFEDHQAVPGFQYFPGFISVEEESLLVNEILQLPLAPMKFQGYEAKRKVLNFGMDWSFEKRRLTKGNPIPQQFSFIIKRVAKILNLSESDFAELLLTAYPPGAVINWHRDAPPFDLVAGVSLFNDCKFRFRPYAASVRKRSDINTFTVQRRSLYIMRGEARSKFEHSISAMDKIRYSITLRTLPDPV